MSPTPSCVWTCAALGAGLLCPSARLSACGTDLGTTGSSWGEMLQPESLVCELWECESEGDRMFVLLIVTSLELYSGRLTFSLAHVVIRLCGSVCYWGCCPSLVRGWGAEDEEGCVILSGLKPRLTCVLSEISFPSHCLLYLQTVKPRNTYLPWVTGHFYHWLLLVIEQSSLGLLTESPLSRKECLHRPRLHGKGATWMCTGVWPCSAGIRG